MIWSELVVPLLWGNANSKLLSFSARIRFPIYYSTSKFIFPYISGLIYFMIKLHNVKSNQTKNYQVNPRFSITLVGRNLKYLKTNK